MPLKTEQGWIDKVLEIKVEHETWGAERIANALKDNPDDRNELPPISVRTVSNILRRKWAGKEEEIRKTYRLVRWPETFEASILPWETAASCLQLIARYRERGWGRPPVVVARAFWRVVRTVPDLPEKDLGKAIELAKLLAAREIAGRASQEQETRDAEDYLLSKKWLQGNPPIADSQLGVSMQGQPEEVRREVANIMRPSTLVPQVFADKEILST